MDYGIFIFMKNAVISGKLTVPAGTQLKVILLPADVNVIRYV